MKHVPTLLVCLLLAVRVALGADVPRGRPVFDWAGLAPTDEEGAADQTVPLPDLPEALGVAGPFGGVTEGRLVVAGGANFKVSPFQGGTKLWHNAIYVLEKAEKDGGAAYTWHTAELKLDGPLAYGASLTTGDGIVCIGGRDATRCYATVFRLKWDNDEKQLTRERLPNLPEPCANHGAALVGDTVYVAGGQSTTDDKQAAQEPMRNFWALDLSKEAGRRAWISLPWPTDAPARILPVAAAQNTGKYADKGRGVYLFSGAELLARPDGSVSRRFLTDAYAYDPHHKDAVRLKSLKEQEARLVFLLAAAADPPRKEAEGGAAALRQQLEAVRAELPRATAAAAKLWTRLADVPTAVVAAPAVDYGPYHILIFGGDDGSKFERNAELGDNHPGFPTAIHGYHTVTDRWVRLGDVPAGHVTTTAARWGGHVVIPSGEDRPGHRSRKLLLATPRAIERRFGTVNYAVLVAYLVALVVMGVYFSRREKSTNDFFLAGQRVPWWAAGLSIYGTQLSAITFVAIPATVFAMNWVPYLAQLCIIAVAPFVIYFYLPFYRRLGVTSAYEYLEQRFNVAVRLLSSFSFIIFQLGRIAVVLYLPAIVLSAATGLPVSHCIIVMGVLCTLYTVLGGIEAVIWTDVLQVVVLLGGAWYCLIVIAGQVDGGFAGIIQVARANGKFHMFNWTLDHTVMAVWVVVLGNLFTNLIPYTSDQAVIQRYLTTKDERAAARGIWTNALLVIPGSLLFFGIGTALYVFFKARPELLEPGLRYDGIFPLFIITQLPAGITGLLIAGVFAASMSSLDSSMNSVATAMVTDFYRRFRRDADDRFCLTLARVITVVLGVLGTLAALWLASFEGKVKAWFLFSKIIAVVGGPLAGTFALAIFSRRANGIGALCGALTGMALMHVLRTGGLMHFYLWPVVGILWTCIVGYLVSLIIPVKKDIEGLTIHTVKRREA